MKRISATIAFVAFIWVCTICGAQSNYYDRVRNLTNWNEVATYVRSLSDDEVWLLVNQVRDKQGNWQAYPGAVLLSLYYGENWERNTPTLAKVSSTIQDKHLNPELRGALAASGFEISRLWTMEDRLKYFDLIVPLFNEDDIPDTEKIRMAEYSFLAFKRCLSEVQVLSEKNVTKTRLLNACHTRAREMMKTLVTMVEKWPKEKASGVVVKTLENYANEYKRGDFPSSPELQRTVEEAAKTDSLLRRYRKN